MRLKSIIILAIILSVNHSLGIENPAQTLRTLRNGLEEKISREKGIYAIAFKDLQTGDTLLIHARKMMHAASTMKVPVMIEVFRQAHKGHFGLSDSVLIRNDFESIVDGSHFSLDLGPKPTGYIESRVGKKVTIYDLVYYMITVSSNLATNILMDMVSADSVMKTMSDIGATDVRILRGVMDLKAFDKGLNNRINAYDLMLIMEAIARKRVVSPEACDEMINIMLHQKHRNKIPAGLPANIKVAHKTGSITAINHDAGIIFLPNGRQYVLAVLSSGEPNHAKSARIIADISKTIYHWITTH